MYYNKSKINRADGVVIYFKDEIIENTETLTVGNITP